MNAEQLPQEMVPQEAYEDLGDVELTELYMNTIGVNPSFRGFDRDTLIAGLKDPEGERARIAEMDRESDKEDLARTYRS